MTMESTKPPPTEPVYFKCSKDECDNKWTPYHGKVGCLCYECDNLTSESMLKNKPEINKWAKLNLHKQSTAVMVNPAYLQKLAMMGLSLSLLALAFLMLT